MWCSVPPALTDDQISALLDGTATAEEQAHLGQCAYCRTRAVDARTVEQRLTTTLNRWGCPSSQQLGEYHLGLVRAAEDRMIMHHLEECALCRAEVEELRLFLGPDTPTETLPQVMIDPPKRRHIFGEVLARLVPRSTAFALRGSTQGPVVAEADGTTIIVEAQATTSGQVNVVGQVAADDQDRWTGALVELRQAGVLKVTARVDDLGGWQAGSLPVAPTDLRITPEAGNSILLPNLDLTP